MVISDKYRYVFVELPLTGSTAISNELCEMYEGKKILRKHSKYQEFYRIATDEQKRYFVFSGIRNPMDLIVSEFLKVKNNHKNRYTTPSEWRKNGGTLSDKHLKLYEEIKQNNMSFQDYFKQYFKLPYDNWSSAAHHKFDFVIRFENLANDFEDLLLKLKIEPKRQLPQINKTSSKEDFIKYYTPDIRKRAVFVFGPFMKKWGYAFPEDWRVKNSFASIFMYKLLGIIKQAYWRATDSKSAPALENQKSK